jgi:DNA transformation protein
MPGRDSLHDYVLEQMAGAGPVRARARFGGYGLYLGERFFGIILRDALHLKVDDATRPRYEAAGMEPFRPYAGRPTMMQYYEVPADVLEDADELARWAAAGARRRTAPRPRRRAATARGRRRAVAKKPARSRRGSRRSP